MMIFHLAMLVFNQVKYTNKTTPCILWENPAFSCIFTDLLPLTPGSPTFRTLAVNMFEKKPWDWPVKLQKEHHNLIFFLNLNNTQTHQQKTYVQKHPSKNDCQESISGWYFVYKISMLSQFISLFSRCFPPYLLRLPSGHKFSCLCEALRLHLGTEPFGVASSAAAWLPCSLGHGSQMGTIRRTKEGMIIGTCGWLEFFGDKFRSAFWKVKAANAWRNILAAETMSYLLMCMYKGGYILSKEV